MTTLTTEEIVEMAREAGLSGSVAKMWLQHFEAFAKLVRNDYSNKHAQLWLKRIDEAVKEEREACAKVAAHYSMHDQDTPADIAESIRARGTTE